MMRSSLVRALRALIPIALVTLSLTAGTARGQLLLSEDFNYAPTTALTANGWIAHSGAGTNPIRVANFGLNYPGYPGTGIGFAAGPMTTSGEDDNRTFTPQTTGVVYAAAMVSVTAAQSAGDYFLHLAASPVNSSFFGRVFARSSGPGCQLGLGFTTEAPTYSPAVTPFGAPTLVVLKFVINPGPNNDQVSLFINPPTGGAEPAPTLVAVNPVSTDPTNIGGIALRQGTAAASASPVVDGIRVGLTWGDVVGVATNWVIVSNAGPGGTIVPAGVSVVPNGGTLAYTITATAGYTVQDVMVDGVSVGPVTSYAFTSVSADHNIVANFALIPGPPVSFEQLSFAGSSGDVFPNSDIGRCRFDYTPLAAAQFMNVVARLPGNPSGAWVVRNVYLPDSASAPPLEHLSARFPLADLGVLPGTGLSQLEYEARVTGLPIPDSVASAWLAAPVWQPAVAVAHPVFQQNGSAIGVEGLITALPEALIWFPSFIPPLGIDIIEWIGCRMPDIDLDDSTHAGDSNGCVPASCANSMEWLASEHPEISLPPDLRQAFDQLSNLMNRMAGQGATEAEMIQAKLDFIEAYGLPIRVDYQSMHLSGPISSTSGKTQAHDHDANDADWPTLDFLNSEASHGEDVELFGGFYYHDAAGWHRDGGHAVVVTGAGAIGGKPFVSFKHDKDQKHAGGTEQETSGIDVVGGAMHVPGLDGWDKVNGVWVFERFWVEGVIGESYDASVGAVGTSESMGDYCQWIIRTIRPGGKLTVTYPHGNRCFNSTVWVKDRTVKPPVWRKVRVWNFNSDSTRVYVNDTPNCVSVAVHNDDHTYSGGTYVPFTLGVNALAAGGSTTSVSNAGVYGGFSLGGADGSSSEFGSPAGTSLVVDASEGMDLGEVPSGLGGAGVQTLTLTHPISSWNMFWSHLELRLRVLSVTSAGNLQVECLPSAFSATILVDHSGLYVVDLGPSPESSLFSLSLTAQPGLEFGIDALGVPSVVVPPLGVTNPATPVAVGLWNLGANPATDGAKLRFDLPHEGRVDLAIFDVRGARVATLVSGRQEAGRHTQDWNLAGSSGRRVAPGLYFARLQVEGSVYRARLVVVQ